MLFGIDAGIGEHEMVALLGTNGAGKSTLLKAVSGLLPPNKGKVTFDGKDITSLPAEKIAALGLSLMPGGKGIFPSLTVDENLRLACWMLRHDRRKAREGLEDVLAMFPILHDRWDQAAGNLSGGEQQQLSLAMAFVTKPKLLCIDELSLGLAPTVVGQLVDKVKDMHAQGTTIVVVEQSINVALLLCERALFLEGQVRFRGPTAGLLDRPEILRAVFIGAGEGTVTAPAAIVPPEQRPNRGLRLECRQLTKRFGGIRAVDAVDLVVEPGHIVGLIGHNGAGKTTLFDLITGFLSADGGQVLLNGTDITTTPPHRRARLELGRSFQEAAVPVAHRRRRPARLARASPGQPRPGGRGAAPAGLDRLARGHRAGRRAGRVAGPGRLPRPPHRRAVAPAPAASSSWAACWARTRRSSCSTSRRRAWPRRRPRRSGRCSAGSSR